MPDRDLRKKGRSWVQWFMLVILATWEVEMEKISVHKAKKILQTPSQPMAGYGGTHLSSQLFWKA
jgi:hypothetical protein